MRERCRAQDQQREHKSAKIPPGSRGTRAPAALVRIGAVRAPRLLGETSLSHPRAAGFSGGTDGERSGCRRNPSLPWLCISSPRAALSAQRCRGNRSCSQDAACEDSPHPSAWPEFCSDFESSSGHISIHISPSPETESFSSRCWSEQTPGWGRRAGQWVRAVPQSARLPAKPCKGAFSTSKPDLLLEFTVKKTP